MKEWWDAKNSNLGLEANNQIELYMLINHVFFQVGFLTKACDMSF